MTNTRASRKQEGKDASELVVEIFKKYPALEDEAGYRIAQIVCDGVVTIETAYNIYIAYPDDDDGVLASVAKLVSSAPMSIEKAYDAAKKIALSPPSVQRHVNFNLSSLSSPPSARSNVSITNGSLVGDRGSSASSANNSSTSTLKSPPSYPATIVEGSGGREAVTIVPPGVSQLLVYYNNKNVATLNFYADSCGEVVDNANRITSVEGCVATTQEGGKTTNGATRNENGESKKRKSGDELKRRGKKDKAEK